MDAETTVTCWECHGRGTEHVQGKGGAWFTVPCFLCGGTGQMEAGEPDDRDADTSEHDAPYDYPRAA